MIPLIRKEWNKKGCFYHSVRTFFQTFFAVVMTNISLVATGNAEFAMDILLSSVIIPALSAACSAVMNKGCSKQNK